MNPWTDSGYKSLGEVQRSRHLRVPVTPSAATRWRNQMTKWAGYVETKGGPQRMLVEADNAYAAEAMLSAYGPLFGGSGGVVPAAEWEQNRSGQSSSSGGTSGSGTIPNALVIVVVLVGAFLKWLGVF
jgi:hypothetical protein